MIRVVNKVVGRVDYSFEELDVGDVFLLNSSLSDCDPKYRVKVSEDAYILVNPKTQYISKQIELLSNPPKKDKCWWLAPSSVKITLFNEEVK